MSRHAIGLALVLPLALALPAGCGEVVAQPIGAAAEDAGLAGDARLDATTDSPVTSDGALPVDSSVESGGDATSFCSGTGPVLPGTNLCAGDLANLFRFAACACTSFDVSGVLATQSLDSTTDAGITQLASIAANQALSTNSTTTIGGSVWAGGVGVAPGSPAVLLSGTSPSTIAHDVQSGGPVEIGGPYEVVGDVWANGNIKVDATGSLKVDGTVHLPMGDTAIGVTATGGIANPAGGVKVPAPCDCSKPIPIGTIVDGFKTNNDDAAAGLTPKSLDSPTGTVTLGCGLYYFDGIHGGSVKLDVSGRVAVFVAGDLSVDQGIAITVEPGAELDLFIKGGVSIQGPSGSVVFGDQGRPAATRVYVGGAVTGDAGLGFTVSADATLSANVYAPSSVVELASNFTLRGSIFAQALQFSGNFAITYDTSVLQVPVGSGCQPPGTGCGSCSDCSGATPACIGGTCAACKVTADCCAPLSCNSATGRCELQAQ